jgi:hypothetical protein
MRRTEIKGLKARSMEAVMAQSLSLVIVQIIFSTTNDT